MACPAEFERVAISKSNNPSAPVHSAVNVVNTDDCPAGIVPPVNEKPKTVPLFV